MLRRLRKICAPLPEVVEEQAWAGVRWCIRRKNFAHVVQIEQGWPPAYAKAANLDGPATVLTVRLANDDYEAFRSVGAPYFAPPWGINWKPQVLGIVLSRTTDWNVCRELLVDSYCLLAPRALARKVRDQPASPT